MDIVFVKDLRFKTIVGCWDWERQMPQTVSIDLEMGWDNSRAAVSGKLHDALNYKEVSNRVEQFVKEQKYELVESAADGIAALVMAEFAVPWIKVAINKPFAVTGSKSVGVVVERGNHA
ncbi:MAG: dihydroneopterin aldolase [Gammaproteobacteria bacterium]|nr:dihydroneopterin aldolase [Gammaproteobacteria bacterium]MCP4088525.1 dihydroneopterin aldolase [Gammaproteobacteria bacterium]MCP4276735.1 dihydroneopterin aldolase [Gammaproteobacteria bacterium]MCP4833056.1 dihydroneopterin aldolase [Gammaproteobacteria bacterium]MCP4928387.1 dihydroneopterin aldolase [Gammaproteobacteria bacterium]